MSTILTVFFYNPIYSILMPYLLDGVIILGFYHVLFIYMLFIHALIRKALININVVVCYSLVNMVACFILPSIIINVFHIRLGMFFTSPVGGSLKYLDIMRVYLFAIISLHIVVFVYILFRKFKHKYTYFVISVLSTLLSVWIFNYYAEKYLNFFVLHAQGWHKNYWIQQHIQSSQSDYNQFREHMRILSYHQQWREEQMSEIGSDDEE